eukprot:273580_1
MAKEKFERSKPHVNIGTIGHVDHAHEPDYIYGDNNKLFPQNHANNYDNGFYFLISIAIGWLLLIVVCVTGYYIVQKCRRKKIKKYQFVSNDEEIELNGNDI